MDFEITINKVSIVDFSWIKTMRSGLVEDMNQTAIQVLDIILRHAPESRFINVSHTIYSQLT